MVAYQPVFEGKLLWSGHRITDFTIRELCNMVFFYHVEKMQPPSEEGEPTIEEQIVTFEESIGQRVSAEEKAMAKFREMMTARGLDPDAKPELSPELAAKLEQDAMKSDQDIFFGDTHQEFMGQKLTDKDYRID